MPAAIVVHAGAGAWAANRVAQGVAVCAEAAAAGRDVLARGGFAVDAVEEAVVILEDCPITHAGRGSAPNRDGVVELDAMIMNGGGLALGSVAAVRGVLHPVRLARAVMERTPHTLLVGAGAEDFADSIGFPRCTNEELLAGAAAAAMGDTVGAVALDRHGDLATATSTGGTPNKMPGRVGDSPLPGCGGYADNASGAVSATGEGEALMKLLFSKLVCDAMANGAAAQAACASAIEQLATRLQAHGGVVALDPRGAIGVACNTLAMPYAYAIDDAPVISASRPAAVNM